MPSQFFGLNIAGSGLRNANAALNTTANNAANTQTEGYSRQQVESAAADALRTYTTYGCAGAGVETLAIERMRDSFYDVKYWNNNANVGQYEVKAYYMKSLEKYLDDDGATGFVTIFNHMKDCLQSVTTNTSSTSTKAQFVASAESMTDYFNNLYGNLQELQKDLNLEIKQCLDQINSISSQLASLNKQINVIELSGSKANDLRDKRDLLIDKLSEYVDVSCEENPIYDTNDPTRETGGTRYVVKIAGGQILVDSNDYSELTVVARSSSEKVNQTDVDGLYKVTWDNGNEFNLNNASLGGKLKGLIELRDGNNGANFNGTVVSADNTAGSRTATIKVTENYLTGSLDECSLPAAGSIRINNVNYCYSAWTFNGTDEYTFVIDDTKPETSSNAVSVGTNAETQDKIKYEGIPYFMTQMNAFIRSFFRSVNNKFENGSDAYGNFGANLFTCELPSSKLTQTQLESTLAADQFEGRPGYYYMTAGNVCISDELLNDPDRLGYRNADPATGKPINGVEECEVVKKVISMLTNKNEYSFRNASANQMLEMILSDVALNASNADTHEQTFKGLRNTIENQRTSISGVDEDEEAVNLVKYQHAYTLASKMIQTLTEVYDQLILRTGV